MELQQEISFDKAEQLVGRRLEVIIEGKATDEDVYVGRTYMDAPDIDNNVVFTSGYEIEDGEIVPVEIFDKDEYSLIGEAV